MATATRHFAFRGQYKLLPGATWAVVKLQIPQRSASLFLHPATLTLLYSSTRSRQSPAHQLACRWHRTSSCFSTSACLGRSCARQATPFFGPIGRLHAALLHRLSCAVSTVQRTALHLITGNTTRPNPPETLSSARTPHHHSYWQPHNHGRPSSVVSCRRP